MSQRQKQRTNENRARRLGTGEGIARSKPPGGGVPRWAWLAGGVVVVALIAVIAAVVLTRGDSSGTPVDPGVIAERNTTQQFDPILEGTWAPNYFKLNDAIKALGLPGLSETVEHYHAHITLVVDGRNAIIPSELGLDRANQVFSSVHTHDERGVIHIEADQKDFRATIGDVFDIWGVSLDNQCVGGFCGGVKIYVNGNIEPQGRDYELQSHDAVTIVAGTPPADFTPDRKFAFQDGE
jgi:hypothetical protein